MLATVGRVPYSVENALYQWEEGERRLFEAPALERDDLERALAVVLTELRRLEREHARLKARLDSLRAPDAIEREARRLGMVRRGEQAFVIENLPR